MSSATSSGSSASKTLLWMTLGLFAGMGVMLIGGFFTAKRVLSTMSLGAMVGNRENMIMPHGKLRLEKQGQVGPPLPVYPTAILEMPGNSAQTIRDAENGIDVAHYHSPDLRETVDSWYHDHLGSEFVRYDVAQQPLPEALRDTHLGDSDLVYVAERAGRKRMVVLQSDENGSGILLIRINEANGAESGDAPASGGANSGQEPNPASGGPAPAPKTTANPADSGTQTQPAAPPANPGN